MPPAVGGGPPIPPPGIGIGIPGISILGVNVSVGRPGQRPTARLGLLPLAAAVLPTVRDAFHLTFSWFEIWPRGDRPIHPRPCNSAN